MSVLWHNTLVELTDIKGLSVSENEGQSRGISLFEENKARATCVRRVEEGGGGVSVGHRMEASKSSLLFLRSPSGPCPTLTYSDAPGGKNHVGFAHGRWMQSHTQPSVDISFDPPVMLRVLPRAKYTYYFSFSLLYKFLPVLCLSGFYFSLSGI